MEWTKQLVVITTTSLILFLIFSILILSLPSILTSPTYQTYEFDFEKAEVIRPLVPVNLGYAASFENRVFINESTLFVLHKSLISRQTANEWFFLSFDLQSNLPYTFLEFPMANISSSLDYRFQGLFYHDGLFYTIGSDFYNNFSLIRFSPSLDWLEVRSLQIPILYETNSSTYWHRVGGLGIFNEILWVFLQGYRVGWVVTYNATLYGLSLGTFEVIKEFPLERPFRFHGCMDENGFFWVYYRNDIVNGTLFRDKTLIGFNLTTRHVQAVIRGDLHQFVTDQTPYETPLGAAYTFFDYDNLIISQNKVIFDDTPLVNPTGEPNEHLFNGFYLIPFS